ncbi:hypothetical protein TVAG_256800 [Trichomonas vaginalis G3]|uniref:Uncharacterized protein n=1 Tax=Trichomonas vaginalis (strain ATCC PRA-98 / G3) TaxID=412133 RepID=A2FEY6_TRIV3|nr:hypothetical protein TVAGG3_0046860 [Trichomonas vaginalis G3]EAX96540.1 hypothetical protein TVAG_256800 [Trichomonas vaginalis G3]KAI5541092.1 hypothetical protein TVAGG3_0046860 [Trichomonas vaginalis G3]|eukprot:XP_001309470.1 hypothetical protein [Trichomonas vaginalis G3]
MTAVLQLGNSTTYYYVFSESTKENSSLPNFSEYQMDFGLHPRDFRPLEDMEVNQTTCPFEKHSAHEFLQYIGEDKTVITPIEDQSQGIINYTAKDCFSLILHMIIRRIRANYKKKLQYIFIIDPNWVGKEIEALQDCIADNEITNYKIVYSDDMISNFLNSYLQDHDINDEKHTLVINSGSTGTGAFIVKTKQDQDPEIINKGYIKIGNINFTNILCEMFLDQFENDNYTDQTKDVIAEIKEQTPNPSKRCFFNAVNKLLQTMSPGLRSKLDTVSLNQAFFESDTIAYDDVIHNQHYSEIAQELTSFIKKLIGSVKIDYYTTVGGNSLNPFFKQIVKETISNYQELCLNNSRCSAISGAIELLSKTTDFSKFSKGKTVNKELTKNARKQFEDNKYEDELLNQYESIPGLTRYFNKLGIDIPEKLEELLDSFDGEPDDDLNGVEKKINKAIEEVQDFTEEEFIKNDCNKDNLRTALTAARDAMTAKQKLELLSLADNIYPPIKNSESFKQKMENEAKKRGNDQAFKEKLLNEFCQYLAEFQQ